jgi:hypothetical protein
MKLFFKIFAALVVLIVIGAGGFLLTWEIPSPSVTTTIIVPNDRFPS